MPILALLDPQHDLRVPSQTFWLFPAYGKVSETLSSTEGHAETLTDHSLKKKVHQLLELILSLFRDYKSFQRSYNFLYFIFMSKINSHIPLYFPSHPYMNSYNIQNDIRMTMQRNLDQKGPSFEVTIC